MSQCGVCVKNVTSKQVKLSCTDCERDFHANCVKMTKAEVEYITADGMPWRCQPCAETRRKSLRFDSEVQEGKITLDDIMKKINEIADQQKTQEINFNKSYELINEKIDENTKAVREQNLKLESSLSIINKLVEENKALNKKVVDLERRLEDIEQYSRVNAVEIHGIPESPNENPVRLVQEVGKALDLEITPEMVDACHRLGKGTNSNSVPGLIVKFVRRFDKEELLRKRRVKRNLSTRHLNMPQDQTIYINEALSPARRRLFAAARQAKREKNFKYLWVRGGKILLRKEESARVVQITCQADLDSL